MVVRQHVGRRALIALALTALTSALLLGAGRQALARPAKSTTMIVFDRYTGVDNTYQVYSMDADGSHQKQLTDNAQDNWGASISPNGKQIVFTSDPGGVYSHIFTMNLNGSGVKQVTKGNFNDEYPAWSPNGKEIVFNSDRSGGYWNVYVMHADGSHQHALTSGTGDNEAPVFSPDGKEIAFSSTRNSSVHPQIFSMHADGSHVKQLTHIKAKNYEPTYSPNGKLIAFESKRSGSENVWMMNSGGGNLRRITKKYGLDPAFSPDGKLIAFDDRKIFTIHTNGSHQHALTHTSLPMADEFPHFGLIK